MVEWNMISNSAVGNWGEKLILSDIKQRVLGKLPLAKFLPGRLPPNLLLTLTQGEICLGQSSRGQFYEEQFSGHGKRDTHIKESTEAVYRFHSI